jgi:hypothetical protein
MEFRWVILLTLWTLMIGPVFDWTHPARSSTHTRAKTISAKSKSVR